MLAQQGSQRAFAYFIRCTGLAGALGGLCLVVGDVLITPLADLREQSLVEIRASVATPALHISGLLGATSVVVYVFAAWHVYLAFRAPARRLGALVLAAFAAMLTSTGIYHAVFIAQNFGAKVSLAAGGGSVEDLALSLPATYSNLFLNLLVIPSGVLFSVLFAYAILGGRTLYPRWFLLFNPLIVLAAYALLVGLVAPIAPTVFSFALIGNVYNLAITTFFVVSTSVLWKQESAAKRSCRPAVGDPNRSA
jgi:hypothetical protein